MRTERAKKRFEYTLLCLALVCAMGLVGAWVWFQTSQYTERQAIAEHEQTLRELFDPLTGCVRDHTGASALIDGYQPETVILLVDMTDPVAPQNKTVLLDKLGAILEEASGGARFIFKFIEPNQSNSLAVQSVICKPHPVAINVGLEIGSESLAADYNARTTAMIERILEGRPLADYQGSTSPLLDHFFEVLSEYATEAARTQVHVVAISDFLNYTPWCNHYKASNRRQARPTSDVYWMECGFEARPDHAPILTAKAVTMLYLRRTGDEEDQTKAHRDFWREWFTVHTGVVPRIKQL